MICNENGMHEHKCIYTWGIHEEETLFIFDTIYIYLPSNACMQVGEPQGCVDIIVLRSGYFVCFATWMMPACCNRHIEYLDTCDVNYAYAWWLLECISFFLILLLLYYFTWLRENIFDERRKPQGLVAWWGRRQNYPITSLRIVVYWNDLDLFGSMELILI